MSRLHYTDIPVIINNFNRLTPLKRLIDWLLDVGQKTIIVIDNASSYPPLLEYYKTLQGKVGVLLLAQNIGHKSIWVLDLLNRIGITSEYIYTDSDVIPADCCPKDLIRHLQDILYDNPLVCKVGPALRLDDLPESYKDREMVRDWERSMYLRPAAPGVFMAPIDTTFALYQPGCGHMLSQPLHQSPYPRGMLRTGWPYVASHDGWYVNSQNPDEEEVFYRATANMGITTWSREQVPAWIGDVANKKRKEQPSLLSVQTAEQDTIGAYRIITASSRDSQDHIRASLDQQGIEPDSLDGCLITEGWRLLDCPARLMTELHRVAKPGALLVSSFTLDEIGSFLEGGDALLLRGLELLADHLRHISDTEMAGVCWSVDRIGLFLKPGTDDAIRSGILQSGRGEWGAIQRISLHFRAEKDPACRLRDRLTPVVSADLLDIDAIFDRVDEGTSCFIGELCPKVIL